MRREIRRRGRLASPVLGRDPRSLTIRGDVEIDKKPTHGADEMIPDVDRDMYKLYAHCGELRRARGVVFNDVTVGY